MRNFVSMELDDEDKLDRSIVVSPTEKKTPDYPWGLRICLCESELKKLGITEDPDVGDLLHFAAMAEVTSYTKSDTGNGPERRIELQITMISNMEDESTEDC